MRGIVGEFALKRGSTRMAQAVVEEEEQAAPAEERPVRVVSRWATMAVVAVTLAALIPTAGDPGLTWDEPAYRYSQILSAEWWESLGKARSWGDIQKLTDPESLLYYWHYGRYGVNFHPPLAGQLNQAAFTIFGGWMQEIPARRMATVLEFALTIVMGFKFLARRYGTWAGVAMAGSLLLMPRLYGQAHLIDTDVPGLLIWAATALALWKGLNEPGAGGWRMMVGVLLGLAFLEKMAAVMVLLPVLGWLIASRLVPAIFRPRLGDWIDGVVTSALMLAPLALAFQQIQFLQRRLPPPNVANLFLDRPSSDWPGAILAVPLIIWLFRRVMGRLRRSSPTWGVERPGLEVWTAILAFAPVIGWLGNPAWWRETLPRLAHYYMLNTDREHVLPRIQILYFGQQYEFSLPWHNGFVLVGITVPAAILAAAVVGLIWGIPRVRRDRLPLYFLVHLLTLPVVRMLPTPAHDGVRLMLPTFFFLSAFAGWGTMAIADFMAGLVRSRRVVAWARPAVVVAVLAPSALALARIHPYELSYYNELIGGPMGAWRRGFELTYWYDAFTGRVLDDLNHRFPLGARVDFLSKETESAVPVFQDQQSLGLIRGDIRLGREDSPAFPHVWLLTQDSKASAFTRLLFGMRPWYASEPAQLDGARVLSVDDPIAVSRAWALFVLLDTADRTPPEPFRAPEWVQQHVPWLGRFWGDGLLSERTASGTLQHRVHRLASNEAVLAWSRSDPDGLLEAARHLARGGPSVDHDGARRLYHLMTNESPRGPQVRHELVSQLFNARPEALIEGVRILNAHRDQVVAHLTHYGYIDPIATGGGYLDRDLDGASTASASATTAGAAIPTAAASVSRSIPAEHQ